MDDHNSGWIYVLLNPVTTNVKIGFSTNPDERIKTLQTGNDTWLVELGRFAGTMEDEFELHNRFERYRIYHEDPDGELHRSEWFRLGRGLRRWLIQQGLLRPDEFTPVWRDFVNNALYYLLDIRRGGHD